MTRLERALLFLFLIGAANPLYAAEGSNLPRIANFAILAVALVLAVRKPLAGYLQARTDQIRAELADAREKTAKADVELAQATALLARLDDEVQKAKQEAKKAAEAERERILSAAETEAARIKEIARKEIDNEVENGRRKLYARATELSVALAHKKIEAAMTAQDQTRLIDRSIELLEKSKS
jgi:F-type H+-transporting ATPase subunit b